MEDYLKFIEEIKLKAIMGILTPKEALTLIRKRYQTLSKN